MSITLSGRGRPLGSGLMYPAGSVRDMQVAALLTLYKRDVAGTYTGVSPEAIVTTIPAGDHIASTKTVGSKAYDTRWGSQNKMLEAFREWVDGKQQSNDDTLPRGLVSPDHSEAGTALRFQVMRRDGFRCATCGRGPTGRDGVKLHVEHVVPASEGGTTVLENLRTRCGQCDATKDIEGTAPVSRVRFPKNCPDEVLLDEVRRIARLVGKHMLTQADFGKLSGISSGTLKRRFGSWHAVLEHAGVGHMCSGGAAAGHCRHRRYQEIATSSGELIV